VIHLDTSFLIRALVRGSAEDKMLRRWLARGEGVGVSSIAWAEFLCGPLPVELAVVARHVVSEPAPFGADHAERAAHLFNASGRRRGTLVDCMVAAVALAHDAALATSNPMDFKRLVPHGLRLELAG
jgi:predicted nucleic acid-binding protein